MVPSVTAVAVAASISTPVRLPGVAGVPGTAAVLTVMALPTTAAFKPLGASPATVALLYEPRSAAALTSLRPKETVSLALEPIWKLVLPMEPSSSFLPPKAVVSAIRVSSPDSAENSCCSAERSFSLLEPLAACRARSRMRCMMLVDSCIAPSAVWAMEIPSLAFLTATFRPLIWLVRRLEICRPAASSLALLILEPEARRSREVDRLLVEVPRLRWAFREAMLLFTVRAMGNSPFDQINVCLSQRLMGRTCPDTHNVRVQSLYRRTGQEL